MHGEGFETNNLRTQSRQYVKDTVRYGRPVSLYDIDSPVVGIVLWAVGSQPEFNTAGGSFDPHERSKEILRDIQAQRQDQNNNRVMMLRGVDPELGDDWAVEAVFYPELSPDLFRIRIRLLGEPRNEQESYVFLQREEGLIRRVLGERSEDLGM